MSRPVAINARFLVHQTTGMQRYANEVASRLRGDPELVRPGRAIAGPAGHLWEQGVLPLRTKGRVLWSPCSTGPLAVRRQVVTVHDLAPLEHPEWFTPMFARLYRLVVERLTRRVPIVLAVSEFTKERLVTCFGTPPQKIRVTGEGAAGQFRPPPAGEIDDALRSHGLTRESYFLFVGSLTPRKNVGHLLRAFERATTDLDPEIRLVLAGAESATNAFPAVSVAADPRVQRLGYVGDRELPALMAGSLAVVVPSHYEGFGLPALEAMSAGAPVVASRTSALPEVVGDAGVLTAADDDEALADALVMVATDTVRRASLRTAGLARAGRFTWDEAARVTDDAIDELVAATT